MFRLFFTVVFFASMAFSANASEGVSPDLPDGNVTIKVPPAPIVTDSDADPYVSVYSSPVVHTRPIEGDGSFTPPGHDWNADVIIYDGRVGSGQDFDSDQSTDDLYVIFDTDHSSQDSAVVYRSQDGGSTWNFWRASYDSSQEINSPRIRVVKDTSGQSWVCMFFLVGNTLRMRYMTPDQSESGWTTVTSADVSYYDVDGEIGNNAYVYVTYVVQGTNDVRAARLSLDDKNWIDDASIFADPQVDPYPSIAAGAGGTVSVALLDTRLTTNTEIRLKRSSNYAASWLTTVQIGNNGPGYDLSWTSIAYDHASVETGWIFATYEGTSDGDQVAYHYTTDGGSSWNYGGFFGGSGDQNMPDVRARKITSGGAVTLVYNSDPGDNMMFSWAESTAPTNFPSPVQVNDYAATGYWPPTAGWTDNFSAIMYTNWNNNYRLCFDWYGNVATEETSSAPVLGVARLTSTPNPFTDMATISFAVTGIGPVSVSVYDISGHLVKTLVDNEFLTNGDHSVQWDGNDSNGASVAPGVYFCRMETGGSVLSTRMVMVR